MCDRSALQILNGPVQIQDQCPDREDVCSTHLWVQFDTWHVFWWSLCKETVHKVNTTRCQRVCFPSLKICISYCFSGFPASFRAKQLFTVVISRRLSRANTLKNALLLKWGTKTLQLHHRCWTHPALTQNLTVNRFKLQTVKPVCSFSASALLYHLQLLVISAIIK